MRESQIEAYLVSRPEAAHAIATYHPRGLFIVKENESSYVAIDNSTCDAWTEDFMTEQDAIDYLEGKENEL